MKFSTKQIHAGVEPDPTTGSILTPIYQTTTYVQPSVDEYMSRGFSYSRSGNPTVQALEKKLAVLEDGAVFRLAAFTEERIVALSDGEIFDIVTHSKGLMPAYGRIVPTADRWAIIAHVRRLQQEGLAAQAAWAANR